VPGWSIRHNGRAITAGTSFPEGYFMHRLLTGCAWLGLALMMVANTAWAQDEPAAAKADSPASPAGQTDTQADPAKDPELKAAIDRASYFYGMQVGMDLAQRGFNDMDPDQIARGIHDVLSGSQPRFSQTQIHEAMIRYQQYLKKKQEEYNRALRDIGQRNQMQGTAFLADNAKRDQVTVLPSGLQYEVIKQADGPSPEPGDTVTAHYTGTLINGKEFDSSHRRGEPLTIALDNVIEAWQEALPMMSVGSKWKLYVPPKLGYKDSLRGPGGPNSTLIFEIELLDFKPTPQTDPSEQGEEAAGE
jgi:FKBP-type peptidyl-prolyl cis-trans isomerase